MVVSAIVVAEFRYLLAKLGRPLGASALLVITDFAMCKVELGPGGGRRPTEAAPFPFPTVLWP